MVKRFQKQSKKTYPVGHGSVKATTIGMNYFIPICATACSCCWDKTIPDDYDGQAEYVAKRSRTGHTSVLEHSNFIMLITVPVALYEDDLVRFLDAVQYLNTRLIKSDDGTQWYLILGGSLRGYADICREIDDYLNAVYMTMLSELYKYAHSGAFEDLCKLGIMDKERFLDNNPMDAYPDLVLSHENDGTIKLNNIHDDDYIQVVSMDDIDKLAANLANVNEEAAKKMTLYDWIKFCSITVLFKNMSRTCTHQLVRHRNAITQESQRYVDYSSACFNSPEIFKPGKYDPNHEYTIRFGESLSMKMTLSEIGDAICKIYTMLNDPEIAGKEYALMKEDARAFLPGNVQCKKIYMTFTIKNLLKFLDLREDPAAQAEIRMYATQLGTWFRSHCKYFSTDNDTDNSKEFIKPRLLVQNIDTYIDEVLEEREEVVPFTDEDLIKASGLDKDHE